MKLWHLQTNNVPQHVSNSLSSYVTLATNTSNPNVFNDKWKIALLAEQGEVNSFQHQLLFFKAVETWNWICNNR